MNRSLKREFKYLIARALKKNDLKLAEQLTARYYQHFPEERGQAS